MCPVIKPQTSFVFVYQYTLKQTFPLLIYSLYKTKCVFCRVGGEVCGCVGIFVLFEGHRSVLLTDLLWPPASSSWGTNSIKQTNLDCHCSSLQLITNHWPPLVWKGTFPPSVICFFSSLFWSLICPVQSCMQSFTSPVPLRITSFICTSPLQKRKFH